MIVTVYTRPGCTLCEQAIAGLGQLGKEFPGFELSEVDIDTDDDLLRRYVERIPVIEAGGTIISEIFYEQDEVRAGLRAVASGSPGTPGQVL